MPSTLGSAIGPTHFPIVNDNAPSYIPPCIPTLASRLPTGPAWLHEPKFDGWRLQIVKNGGRVALITRGKNDIAKRFPNFVRALVPCARSCVIDAELLSSDGNFWAIPTAISLEHITIAAFDLMHLDGVDLRLEPLVDRKARLAELVARAGLPSLIEVAHFDDGAALLAAVEVHGLERIKEAQCALPVRSEARMGESEVAGLARCTPRAMALVCGSR